jgi:hypothetical protein
MEGKGRVGVHALPLPRVREGVVGLRPVPSQLHVVVAREGVDRRREPKVFTSLPEEGWVEAPVILVGGTVDGVGSR